MSTYLINCGHGLLWAEWLGKAMHTATQKFCENDLIPVWAGQLPFHRFLMHRATIMPLVYCHKLGNNRYFCAPVGGLTREESKETTTSSAKDRLPDEARSVKRPLLQVHHGLHTQASTGKRWTSLASA